MHALSSIADLPRADAVAVIINCGTKWVSSLALASTLRHAGMPVLLIDCESADGSRAHFAALAQRHGWRFHWLEWPLRSHPATLNRLLREVPAEAVMLVDSDLEIPDAALVGDMRAALASDRGAYGAGFLHGPCWMDDDHALPPRTGWYAQRMWIPLTLLRTAPVRALLDRVGFDTRRSFTRAAWLGHLACSLGVANPPRSLVRWRRAPGRSAAAGEPLPVFVEQDTGARLHEALLASGWRFAQLPTARWGDVRHLHGVTRSVQGGTWRQILARLGMARHLGEPTDSPALDEALGRLETAYGIDVATARTRG